MKQEKIRQAKQLLNAMQKQENENQKKRIKKLIEKKSTPIQVKKNW